MSQPAEDLMRETPEREPTDEKLRAIDRRARERLAATQAAEEPVSGVAGALADRDGANRRPALTAPPDAAHVHRCEGGCHTEVLRRGDWCAACAEKSHVRAAEFHLANAYNAVSPDGARDWCRAGNPDFDRAMSGTPQEPGIRRLYAALPAAERTEQADAVMRGTWSRSFGNLVLLGPTGIGKSVLMSAIALKILDRAKAGKLEPHDFRVAAGIKYVSAAELAKAPRRHRLGDGDPPLLKQAKRATILLLDEVAYGDDRDDVQAMYEIMRSRYEPQWKPTIMASGRTVEELVERYGATARCFWPKGNSLVINMHPRNS